MKFVRHCLVYLGTSQPLRRPSIVFFNFLMPLWCRITSSSSSRRSMCGTPVGVMDPATGPQIEALKNQIAAIDERLNRIAKALQD